MLPRDRRGRTRERRAEILPEAASRDTAITANRTMDGYGILAGLTTYVPQAGRRRPLYCPYAPVEPPRAPHATNAARLNSSVMDEISSACSHVAAMCSRRARQRGPPLDGDGAHAGREQDGNGLTARIAAFAAEKRGLPEESRFCGTPAS